MGSLLIKSQIKVCFRVDASLEIGSGHVMRCITLAEALRYRGMQCHFICRAHPGHLFELIKKSGFNLYELPANLSFQHINLADSANKEVNIVHQSWLGSDWQTDAAQTGAILSALQPEWLITDHYALAQPWEELLSPYYQKLMVIDDLADRIHRCDLLLDQNLGRHSNDYLDLLPAKCQLLIGPQFALLRPEFAELRAYSLVRRAKTRRLKNILISMGGVDMPNATARVLEALKICPLSDDSQITVIMGDTARWQTQVLGLASQMPWTTKVLVNVKNMARIMAESDLAIGAAGSTSWERCCLGLPTLMVVLSNNQINIASGLDRAGAAISLGLHYEDRLNEILIKKIIYLINHEIMLHLLSEAAAKITEGHGTQLVVKKMLSIKVI